MNIFRLLLTILAPFGVALTGRAVDAYFTHAPSSVNGGESYFVRAEGYSNFGVTTTLYKGGSYLNAGWGYPWAAASAWTSDSGPQTVNYMAEAWDWEWGYSAYDYRSVTINGGQSNQPPVAWVEVDGQLNGSTVIRPYGGSVAVTVRYKATDPDGNLSGIRPQVWRPDGHLDNNGGNFVGQSGSNGEVTWTVYLNQNGNWYFWTDAQDSVIAPSYVDSGSWGNGFRINVIESAPPPQAPSVLLSQPSGNITVSVGQSVTLQSYAEDFTRPLTTHNIDIQRPDGSWNWQGGFAYGEPYMGGPVGPDSPTASTRSAGFTFNQVGTWQVRAYAANNANLSTHSVTRTVTVLPLSQASVSLSPTSQTITAGQSITFTASGGSGTGAYTWGGSASGTGSSKAVTFNSAGTFSVTVYRAGDSTYAQSNTATATITVNAGQIVAISPTSASVTVGQSVNFTASGGGGTGDFVWGGDASGTGASKSVTFNTAGNRTVTVYRQASTGYSQSNTATANITVAAAPAAGITQHPLSQTALIGSTVTFSVTATGSGTLAYQWKKDGTDISGATSATLTLDNLQYTDAAGYSVVVTHNGTPVTSNTAWLPIANGQGGGSGNASSPAAKDRSPVAPGLISTAVGGSGYDIATGSYRRVIHDFQVNGSVGAYPLGVTRSYTREGLTYSFVWTAEELADQHFIQNPSLNPAPMQNQYVNVRTPDGQVLHFVANEPVDGTWNNELYQSNDGIRVALVRHPFSKRVESMALYLPAGGFLMMEKCSDVGAVRKFRAVRLVDPFGIATTFTYSSPTAQVPYQVTDAAGRYLRFTTSGSIETITRVESSDNKWIQWSGSTLNYWDGTSATYAAGDIDANTRWVRFSDVRAASPMRNVEYVLSRIAYGATGNFQLDPNEPEVWEVVRERTFTTIADPVDSGPLVSKRIVNARSQFIEDVGVRATGPAVDVTEERGDGATRNFTFQIGGGRMTSATDFRGNRSYFRTWFYDVPSEIEDARGNKTNLESNFWARISKITHPLTEVAPFLDGSEATQTVRDYREYQWTGRFLTGERDERGNWTYYDRDAQNRIWRIRYADNSWEQFYYNSLNQLEKRRLRNGAFEYWDYYADTKLPYRYWPANEANPGNATTQPHFEYTYYSTGPQKDLLHTSRDPRGKTTTYEYFASGRLQKEIFHDLTFRSYTYDDWGNRLSVTDERGKTTDYTYDAYSRLQSVTDPEERTTLHDYTPSRNDSLSPLVHVATVIRRTTLPSLRKTAYKHDDDYHVTEEIRGEGSAEEAKSFTQFDAVGNATKRTEQVSTGVTRVTDFVYDARNRKRIEFAPLNRTTRWKLDPASNVVKVTNPDDTFTTKTYNAMNQVETSSDEMFDTTEYRYYPSGLVWKIIDPRLKEYVHTYDAVGRIKTRTYPDNPQTQEKWDYDAAGNVEFYYNRSNQKQTYTYDDRNRELSRAWDGNVAPAVKTTYYANGLVWTRANGTMSNPASVGTFSTTISTVTNTYHDAGALHTQQQAIVGGPSVTLTFGYDADGRRQTFNGGTGRDLGYTYNARGGLHKVKLGGLNGTDLATYTYNLAEQRQTRTSGNGIVADHNYDAAGRLNYLGATNVLRLDFGHDSRDRRTWTLRDQNLGDTYEYFNDSELYRYRHGVTRPDQNFNNPAQRTDTFDYDESGNRREFNRGGTLTTYTAGDDNRYTAVSGVTIAHDARGNVTTWDGKTFGYDADNRLVSASASGLNMTFTYDGDGRLVKLVKNGVTEYRFYDGAQVFLRTDGNGTAIDWTVWGPTPDEVIARNVSGAWQFYHQDQINSVYAVTNAAGSVLERYLYDPFGLPDVRNASWSALGTASAIGNPWLFTGQEWRSDLGLSNYKARWYQPSLGRFMQNDPVRFDAGDINLYRYCFNDPVNMTDPDGQVAFLIPVAIWAGKMALGYAADKALDYAQENLVPEEHKETVSNIRNTVDTVRAVTGDLKALKNLAKHGDDLLGAVKKELKEPHANKVDDRPATLYEKYDKDGNFLKHGVTKHEDPAKRYTKKEIGEGKVVPIERGPRSEMLKKERERVETNPGPDNRERWAGKRQKK